MEEISVLIQSSEGVAFGRGPTSGTPNPHTTKFLEKHFPDPKSPDILCTDENLADFPSPPSLSTIAAWPFSPLRENIGWSPTSLESFGAFMNMPLDDWLKSLPDSPGWPSAQPSPRAMLLQAMESPPPPAPEPVPAPAPAPAPPPVPAPAPPSPLAEIRIPAPLQFHRVEAPGAVVIPVYQDTDRVYQDKGCLVLKAVMPQESGDRVRVAYNELVWFVTGTYPPQHSNTGQRSLHCQKGLVDFLLPLGVKAMPSSVAKGQALAYIKWPDIDEGVQWNVNGCRDEPVMQMEPVFVEKIEAIKKACEMLETQGNSACVSNEFCVRVAVPPSGNTYVVGLMLEVQRLRKNNSACRPAGGRYSVGRVDKLVEDGKRKQKKRKQKDD